MIRKWVVQVALTFNGDQGWSEVVGSLVWTGGFGRVDERTAGQEEEAR